MAVALALASRRPPGGVRHDRGRRASACRSPRSRRAMTVSPAVNQTRIELVRALGAHNLVLTDSQAPVRPAEAPLLAAAPRAVYQVILPKDPSHGFIVVYEFPDPARAAARGRGGAGVPGDRPGAGPDAARDGLDHPPGRLDGRLLRLAAAGFARRFGAGDPGGARDARGRVPGRELARRGCGRRLIRRPAAACPPRPTPGPARA